MIFAQYDFSAENILELDVEDIQSTQPLDLIILFTRWSCR